MALLYLNTLQSASLLPSLYLYHCIDQLNELYRMELNVHLDLYNSSRNLNAIATGSVPTLWLHSLEPQSVLRGNFSEKTLTIVYLKDGKNLALIVDFLGKWSWEEQYRNVIFIYPKASSDELMALFKVCWRQGMVQILAVLPYQEKLYSFLPYPNVHLLPLEDVQQFYDRTRKELCNLQGYTINIAILSHSAPFAFIFRNRKGNVVYAGYMLRMLLDFIRHYNGSASMKYVYRIEDATAALGRRDVDFLPFLLARTENFTGSVVLWMENLFVMAPVARPLPKYMYLIKPYSMHTWLIFLTMIVYCSHAWNFLHRGRLSRSSAFLQILRYTLFLPPGTHMEKLPGARRLFVHIMFILAGFVFTNLYLALLSSMLATGLYERQLNSFDDLADTNLQLVQYAGDMKFKLAIPDLHPELAKRMVTIPEEMVDVYRRGLNTSVLHTGFEDRIDFAFYQQKFLRIPLMRKMPVAIYQQPFYIPMAYDIPYIQLFNWYVRRIFEGGLLLKIKSDCYEHGIQSGDLQFIKTRNLEVDSNSLEYYYFMCVFWAAGMLLALLLFICECLWKSVHNQS
ncbi:uncharacterized protein LOC115622400 [Scaptodrosophila lebanonensis]|uniref:Uncharacterized protein LOC115622400 n=1 Tax=Drosophila lebanonensis TaxID=7225 RepID=A0A6J2TA25_DROLE|nr:uncharacterized protein LOC115622400 [Scaptodrosophila lebanonensis]